jgi:hypothetical protein
VALLFTAPQEPSYGGKKLSELLYDRPMAGNLFDVRRLAGGNYFMIWDESADAVRAIGRKALPTLLGMLEASDSALTRKFIKLASEQRLITTHFHFDGEKHQAAMVGFSALGTNALSAVPELIQLSRHADATVRETALVCLDCVAPAKDTLLPVLEAGLRDSDNRVKSVSAEILAKRYPDSAERLGIYELYPQFKPEPETVDATIGSPAK